MKVAIIPARGGSKRIPRKNIKNFCGKPMIAWSIEAAKASDCFDKIIVSTDDDKIASLAKEWGAEVPFIRPDELSDDYTGTTAVIGHAIKWLDENEEKVEFACCIYATAPFVSPLDIKDGWQAIKNSNYDYAFSVTTFPFPIQRAIKITEQGNIEMFNPEHFMTRSQDLEEAFHDAGQFYWGRAQAWREGKVIFGKNSVPIKLPRYRVQDIDTPEDWSRAEWLFRSLRTEGQYKC